MQSFNHIPPPPPTTASSFFTSTAYGSSVQTIKGEYHVSSLAPPPPSSPPPIPALPVSTNPPFSISKPSAPSFGEGATVSDQVRDGTSLQPGDVPLLNGSEMLSVPPPPLKPTEAKTIRRIEDLCQHIVKNGPGVEDVTRQSEYGNPEYEFLFGGGPRSEAAIGYEYFLWLKKKCLLEHKFHEEQSEPAVMPLEMDSSRQLNVLIASAGCTSTSDSDMEMEDDITLFDKEQEMNLSAETLLHIKEHDIKKQLHAPKISPERSLAQGKSSEQLSCESLFEQSEGLSSKPDLRFHSQVMDPVIAADRFLDSDPEKTVFSLPDNLNPSGASVASETINLKEHNEAIKGGSPIRLLQDYASDDDSENDDELLYKDINPSTVRPSLRPDASSSSRHTGRCVETVLVAESQHCIGKSKKVSRWQSESILSQKAADCSPVSPGEVKDGGRAAITTRKTDGYVDGNPGKQSSGKDVSSHADFRKKAASGGPNEGVTEKENEEKKAKFESASLKVDEFGRLARESSNDSDSDSRYANRCEKRGKRGRSRSRSRSRSPSPVDRRRTRRSSWRRKEKRSRSRSWSPRNRRSRSRSPSYRRAGEFSGLRSDWGRVPACFDFIRGRCDRGARCRYMHHEVGKNDTSRHQRSKQKYLEVPSGSKNYRTKKESNITSTKHPEHVRDEAHIQEMQDGKADWKKEDDLIDSQKSNIFGHGSQLIDSGMGKCQSPRGIAGMVQEKQIIPESSAEPKLQIPDNKTFWGEYHQPPSVDNFPSQFVDGADIRNSRDDTSREDLSSVKNPAIHQSQSHISVAEYQNGDCLSHEMEGSSVSDASPKQRTLTSPRKPSKNESFSSDVLPSQSLPNASSSQALSSEPVQFPAPRELSPLNYSVPTIPQQSLQLPPPPPLPHTHTANAPLLPQFPLDYSSMPHVASYPLQPVHVGNSQTYHASVASQHPQFSGTPNSSWSSLPPPPPPPPRLSHDLRFNAETATPGVSSQFQQSHFPLRNDFGFQIPAYPNELHSNSLHQARPSIQEPRQPNFEAENTQSGNSISQFGAPSLLRDDRFTHPPIPELNSSSSLGHGNLHQQSVASQELSVNRMLPFSHDVSKSSSDTHPFSHNQLSSGHLQYPLGDSSLTVPGKPGSMSQYPPDLLDGVSRFSAHYNPYASTFEQPFGSKFSSTAFSQDNGALSGNQYDTPFGLRHVAVHGQGLGSVGSRQATSSPSFDRAVGQILPTAGGEQYDPLFDSIDRSSNAKRKDHHGRKSEPVSESDPTERCGGSYKALDSEEKNRHEVAAVASTTSLENDEFGETADAEVGSVENESPREAVNVATAGEIGTETKSLGKKKKKKKDSRSTKPFKIAIADFVKDVLKPSWQQGNMSKEAFKTIVKKTVDKVSGAMKGHQMPKSQAKINHYIDSQQRKLTKLVMGYVDKYVKV